MNRANPDSAKGSSLIGSLRHVLHKDINVQPVLKLLHLRYPLKG